jgi:replicative DNA helicase
LDYVQLATTKQPGLRRYQEVGEVAKGLKALAKELKVPVLAASQISREVDRRPDRRPTLSDLRESGDLEQHADIVMFIHREIENAGWNDADIIIAKHRNGPLGTAKLLWQPDWVRFVAMAPTSAAA